MRGILKWLFIILLMLVGIAFLWLRQPTVKYQLTAYGTSFSQSLNWNPDTLEHLKSYVANAPNVDAFIALKNGEQIFEYGATDQLINLHSARKPVISLLLGIARDKGLLRMDETLKELNINEFGKKLTEQESSATIRDLLMSRSGVYLEADAEIASSKKNRPGRGQYKPGEFYFYNNFDFNALGTILKIKSGMTYEQCLEEWLAKPLGMQDFHRDNVIYGTPFSRLKTDHPAYKTWMSARDLAKIGVLIAQDGIWKGQRIVSSDWINESTEALHQFSKEDFRWPLNAYGYLWHLDTEKKNIWATGYGGQCLMIDTTNQFVLVQRHYTGNSLLSQGLYLRKNTQSRMADLMTVWYTLLRN